VLGRSWCPHDGGTAGIELEEVQMQLSLAFVQREGLTKQGPIAGRDIRMRGECLPEERLNVGRKQCFS
jgi:hypothetical protein